MAKQVENWWNKYEPEKSENWWEEYEDDLSYAEQFKGALAKGAMRTLGEAPLRFTEHTVRQLKLITSAGTLGIGRLLGRPNKEILERMSGAEKFFDNSISALEEVGALHKMGQEAIIKNHPEWESEPSKSFMDLLTHPDKLALALAESTPLLLAAGILTAAGAPQLSVGLMYAAEGQDAYDQAIDDGQSKETAEIAYVTYGTVAAALEQMQLQGIMRIGKGAFTHVLNRTTQKIAKKGLKSLTMDIIKTAASEALEEMSQGAWGEATSKIVYDKSIPDGLWGFIDRRLQEGLIGAVMGVIPGLGGAGAAQVRSQLNKLGQAEAPEGMRDEFEQKIEEDAQKYYEKGLTKTEDKIEDDLSKEEEPIIEGEVEKQVKYGADGSFFVLGKNTKQGEGPWRITYFDEKGKGFTHRDFKTKSEAQTVFDFTAGSLVKGEVIKPTVTEKKLEDLTPETIETAEGTLGVTDLYDLKDEQIQRIPEEAEAQPVVKKLLTALRSAEDVRGTAAERIRKEKGKRFSEAEERAKEGGIKSHYAVKSALKGALKAPEFTPLKETLTDADINELVDVIRDSELSVLEQTNAIDAITKGLMEGYVPAPFERELLRRAFGEEVGEELFKKLPKGQRRAHKLASLLHVNKSLLASFDLSAGGRQAAIHVFAHPGKVGKTVRSQYKIFLHEEDARAVQMEMATSEYYDMAVESGLNQRIWGKGKAALSMRDELFMSDIAQDLPIVGTVVKRSERAHVIGLNKLALDLFSSRVMQWEEAGVDFSLRDTKILAGWINDSLGRANIPKTLEKYMPFLTLGMFSPRLLYSRIKVLTYHPAMAVGELFTESKYSPARKAAVADLTKFVGGVLTVLGLMAALGYKIEWDLKESDFGKIQWGKQRIDITGGYAPLVRDFVRIVKGEVTTATGREIQANRMELILRFLRYKLNPPVGAAVNILTGETPLGEELNLKPMTLLREVERAFVPLVIQDIAEAIYYQGWVTGLVTTPLAFHGVGVQTYDPSPSEQIQSIRNHYARETFGTDWDQLGKVGQEVLEETRPIIGDKVRKIKAEQEVNYEFVGRIIQQDYNTARDLREKMTKGQQRFLEQMELPIKGLGRKVGKTWYLNDTRYDKLKSLVFKGESKFTRKLMNNSQFKKLDPQIQRMYFEQGFDLIRKAAREMIINESKANDLVRLQSRL